MSNGLFLTGFVTKIELCAGSDKIFYAIHGE